MILKIIAFLKNKFSQLDTEEPVCVYCRKQLRKRIHSNGLWDGTYGYRGYNRYCTYSCLKLYWKARRKIARGLV